MKRHARKGTARQEELSPSLNPASSAPQRDSRTTTDILDGDESSLMYPQSAEKNFDAAYVKADTLKRKITVITRAIEHFYPQISQTQRLSGAKLRLPMTHPILELQKWIKKGDELWTAAEQKPGMQVVLIATMQDCWEKYHSSASPDKTPKSVSELSAVSEETESSDFLVEESEEKSRAPTASLAAEEWAKWTLRQQQEKQAALTSASTLSSCCVML